MIYRNYNPYGSGEVGLLMDPRYWRNLLRFKKCKTLGSRIRRKIDKVSTNTKIIKALKDDQSRKNKSVATSRR